MTDLLSSPEESFKVDLAKAILDARDGNPIPYVKLQWPDVVLDGFQIETLNAIFNSEITEVYIKGCAGPGKGFAVSIAVNVWFDVFDESKTIISSSSFEDAKKKIFGEISKCRRNRVYSGNHGGEDDVRTKDIHHNVSHYVIISNPDTGEGMSGQHGPKTLFVFDEASAVSDSMYTNAMKQSRMIVALSNPRTLSGFFRKGFDAAQDPDKNQVVNTPSGRRKLISVGGMDCTNVKNKCLQVQVSPPDGIEIDGRLFEEGESIPDEYYEHVKPIIPGQITYSKYMETMSHVDPNERAVFAEGKFPSEDLERQVLPGTWIERHVKVWHENLPVDVFALDVAASATGDKSVLAVGSGSGILALHCKRLNDTMELIGWVLEKVKQLYNIDLREAGHPLAVDFGGVGKPVGQRLKEIGVWVHPISGGSSPTFDKKNYANKRAELYGEFALRLSPTGAYKDDPFPLPPKDWEELRQEFNAHEKIYGSDGVKFSLLSKDKRGRHGTTSIREKLNGRSPDKSDAVVMLYDTIISMERTGPVEITRPLLIEELVTGDEPTDPMAAMMSGITAMWERDDQLEETGAQW